MPVQYEIDVDENLITITGTGTTRYDDLVSAFVERTKEKTYRPGMNLLFDGRRTNFDITTDEMMELVRFFSARRALRGTGFRFALVSDSDLTFGLGRMFEGFAAELPEDIRVFRDFEKAKLWVTGAGE